MKALITGISGFVGSYLSKYLLDKNIEVFGLDKSKSESNNTYSIDILDKRAVSEVIEKVEPDLIFHLAGFSSVKKSFEQPELCMKVNVDGTKNLLDAVLKAGINPKILIISSSEVYGIPKAIPSKETDNTSPVTPYGKSRLEQEKICINYFKKYKLNIIISRSFTHIGPGQQPIFVVSDFAKQIAEIEKKNNAPIIKVGNFKVKRDFTDVRDIVKAYFLTLQKGKIGEIYNICSGKSFEIQQILDKLLDMSEKNIEVKVDPDKVRKVDIPILIGDNSKFMSHTGWVPEIPIEKTLRDVLDYWRKKVS